jgi:fructosamine-3-kinase
VKREDKNKGQKRTSPTVNSGYGQKSEKKRSMTNDNETLQNWGRIFAEQNLLYMKRAQSSMSAKHGESKETRKHVGTKRPQTNVRKALYPFLSRYSFTALI